MSARFRFNHDGKSGRVAFILCHVQRLHFSADGRTGSRGSAPLQTLAPEQPLGGSARSLCINWHLSEIGTHLRSCKVPT